MSLPAVNPYNKDEIEYQEAGFDYAPKYPGSYDYNESGIAYAESGFPYQKRDATVSVSTIGCSADLSPVFTYVYTPKRPGGVAYQNPYEYNKTGFYYNERDTTVPDNRVLVDYSQSGVSYRKSSDAGHTVAVIATPATIGVTTTFSASPSVPATVSPDVIACAAVISTDVTANTITIHGGTLAEASVPSVIISATVIPAAVAAGATIPEETLYITVDATPGVIAATADLDGTDEEGAKASGNYTATPTTIGVGATTPTVTMFRYLVIPTAKIVPSVGLRDKPTPAAYALMRHYEPGLRGDNIFIINGTSVQDFLPADKTTVTRWIYGGHESPKDLTDAEETVLLAAGYSFRVGPG
ncbi:MAG: hypothetical protein CL881_08660 [Dehalococcoidia bacterium]|nr:hypothetical protein [Dehalococcoidia bacterium]